MITACNPCKNKNVNLGTTYQQQRRYFITKKKDLTCPFILLSKYLVKQIKRWQAAGDGIILFMDHNKQVINRALGRALADKRRIEPTRSNHPAHRNKPRCNILSKPIGGL
jgi:hypothetical protein